MLADPQIAVAPIEDTTKLTSPPSPLNPEVVRAVEENTRALWPGVLVLPMTSTGGTDGWWLRRAGIPTYGVSGIFEDFDDIRWHGRDERMGVEAFYEGREFLYRLVKTLSLPKE